MDFYQKIAKFQRISLGVLFGYALLINAGTVFLFAKGFELVVFIGFFLNLLPLKFISWRENRLQNFEFVCPHCGNAFSINLLTWLNDEPCECPHCRQKFRKNFRWRWWAILPGLFLKKIDAEKLAREHVLPNESEISHGNPPVDFFYVIEKNTLWLPLAQVWGMAILLIGGTLILCEIMHAENLCPFILMFFSFFYLGFFVATRMRRILTFFTFPCPDCGKLSQIDLSKWKDSDEKFCPHCHYHFRKNYDWDPRVGSCQIPSATRK